MACKSFAWKTEGHYSRIFLMKAQQILYDKQRSNTKFLPGSVSYHYLSHQYGKHATVNYLKKIGSSKQKIEHS